MAKIIYATFESEEAAKPVLRELTQRTETHPNFPVQTHASANLDGDDMPESATEVGRNTTMGTIVGGVVGLILGAVVGSTGLVLGLSTGIGAAVGMIFGVLVGVLNGMMAGTRTPKEALRVAAAALSEGQLLVTVEVDDPGHADIVTDILKEGEGAGVGRC